MLLLALTSDAQRPNYVIQAQLNTSNHTITGSIEITYTNYAYQVMDSLGIHLWPNAYSRQNTALDKQMLLQGQPELHRAKPDQLGSISSLEFTSPAQEIDFAYDPDHVDIGWLVLSQPLRPSESITIRSPFVVQLPETFSRSGHAGLSYQVTQWYPHLAVFDKEGWHTMPYLELGEYFNDFADYRVSLTLPNGYVVAGTGFIDEITETDTATHWQFIAENVIDFAWFASPNFYHTTYDVNVGGAQSVKLNMYIDTLYSEAWKQAHVYAERALQFYSEWLGPYPYPQMSVVYAPLGVGGGMEYPMVAHIGDMTDAVDLDILIAHEVGHSWLYGILANNEREHPWMDEGLNTFLEEQYINTYYPNYVEYEMPKVVRDERAMETFDVLQRYVRFNHTLQPPASDPQYQDDIQYFFSAYELPKLGLQLMQAQYGEATMKKMFQDYYATYKFTHVTPELLEQSFEKSCDCTLDWFFNDWMHDAHTLDYRIKKFRPTQKEITLVNKGDAKLPVKINTFKDGEPLKEHWINGFSGEKTIHLNVRADEVRLYDGLMQVNGKYTSNIRPRTVLPRIRFGPQFESYDRPTIGITPFFGVNLADGFMPGLAFTSGLLPQDRFKFVIAPMYGAGSKKVRGHATLRFTGDVEGELFDKYVLSLGLDDFGYNLDTHYLFRDHYVRWSPSIAFRFSPQQASHHTQWLKYRYVNIDQYYHTGIDYVEKLYTDNTRSYGVHEVSFLWRSDFVLRPFTLNTSVQAGQGFVRVNVWYDQHFRGKTKHHGVWVRGFAGILPVYDNPDANVQFLMSGLASNGFYSKDYMYDEWLGGRNAEGGFFGQQVFVKDGGLKTLSTIGIGDNWMLGSGVSVAMPFRFIHLYMDAAYYESAVSGKNVLSYSGGASLVLLKDVFEVYLPFLESKDIRESLSYVVKDRWYERISFQANIKLANPLNLLDKKQLGY